MATKNFSFFEVSGYSGWIKFFTDLRFGGQAVVEKVNGLWPECRSSTSVKFHEVLKRRELEISY